MFTEAEKKLIEDFVKIWETTHTAEFSQFLVLKKQMTEIQTNQFASSRGNNMRYLLEVPQDLMIKLQKNFPILSKGKNWQWFAKKFPQYRIAERV